MQRVRILVPRSDSFPADTAVEVYGDLGGGTIDYDHPLPPGRMRLWPVAADRAGHLADGHLLLAHLDSVAADGHLHGTHLWDGHLRPVWSVAIDSPRYVFGRFRHAVRLFDGAGNAAAPPMEHARTVNAAPAAPDGLRRAGGDETTRRLRFTFTPVRFTPARGS